MADVFVSYASDDRERVAPLALALVEYGWSVWWDRQIHPGETFDEVIERELDAALAVICVWTVRGVASRWVRTEAAEGLARGRLVPVMVEEVRPPLAFRRIQAADLTDWEPHTDHAGFDELVAAVDALVRTGVAPQPAPSPPRDPLELALVGARERAGEGDWTGVIAVLGSLDASTAGRATDQPEVDQLLTLARHKRDAAELYDEAEVLYSERRWQAAVAKLDRVLELDPDDTLATDLMRRAQQHVDADRAEHIAHLHDRATSALAAREWPVAIARFQELLEYEPGHAEAGAGLARAEASAATEVTYRELQAQFDRKEWSAVAVGMAELVEKNRDFGDPADLLARAEARLAEDSRAEADEVIVEPPTEEAAPDDRDFEQRRAPAIDWMRSHARWLIAGGALVVLATAALLIMLDGSGGTQIGEISLGADATTEQAAALERSFAALDDRSIAVTVSPLDGDARREQLGDLQGWDVLITTDPGALIDSNRAIALPGEIAARVEANFAPWSIAGVARNGQLYGVPVTVQDIAGLVWYSPSRFREHGFEVPSTWTELESLVSRMTESGAPPWGLGLHEPHHPGDPITAWFEAVMLRRHGPEIYEEWMINEVHSDTPRVEQVAGIIEEVLLRPGHSQPARMPAVDASSWEAGLCVTSGDCWMYLEHQHYGQAYLDVGFSVGPDRDVDVFLLPSFVGERFLGAQGIYAIALSDRPAALDVMEFIASPDFADETIRGLPGFFSLNLDQDLDLYEPAHRSAAEILVSADLVAARAIRHMPDEVYSEWREAGAEWVGLSITTNDLLERVEAAWP